jgi:HK97 family phage prohead protease
MENKTKHNFNIYCKNFKVKKAEGSEAIVIEGYANTTDKDRQGDVILSEAWTKGGLDNYLKNPIVLAYHNPEKPIGEVIDYGVNNKGLHVVAEISKTAGDVYTLIREGILKAFSVGFRVKDADYDTETDIFVIKDLEMYELSVVTVPANADSIFSVRKSFETEEDYLSFKQLYKTPEQDPIVEPTKVETTIPEPKVAIKENTKVEDKTFTQEELEAAKSKAVQDALAAIEAKKQKDAELEEFVVRVGKSAEERLAADFEKKLAEKDSSLSTALEELRNELKEKKSELEAMFKNKMSFENPGTKAIFTDSEIDTAVLASKALGMPIEETKYYKELVTKAGAHLATMTTPADWENLFSTRMYEDIKDKTIIEPLFTQRVQMNSRTMTFPYNPEAGVAQWISDSYYNSSKFPPSDAQSSTGTAVVHKPKDNTITAQKLASKEYLGYEEEEDAIIALMPLVRDAVMRRMVRTTDTELLRANAGAETVSGQNNALIDGVSTIAADGGYDYTQPGAFGDPATIADLQQTRRTMGTPGLMPGDIVYVVSQSVYFDLLEDPDFRTMDLVGPNATILRGQVGSVNGSPVVISDAFAADAAGTVQAVAFNSQNYLFGELRGLMVERDRDIENQKNIIVATRRFGMTEIVPSAGAGRSFCANLVRPAS